MAENPRLKALKEAGRAQAQFEKSQQRLDELGATRRERFRQAAAAGASMAEIAEAVGLHRSRVNQTTRANIGCPSLFEGLSCMASDQRTAAGYGFITPDDDGKELFVHHNDIDGGGFKSLSEGAKVSFEAESSDRGPKAVNVRSL